MISKRLVFNLCIFIALILRFDFAKAEDNEDFESMFNILQEDEFESCSIDSGEGTCADKPPATIDEED